MAEFEPLSDLETARLRAALALGGELGAYVAIELLREFRPGAFGIISVGPEGLRAWRPDAFVDYRPETPEPSRVLESRTGAESLLTAARALGLLGGSPSTQ